MLRVMERGKGGTQVIGEFVEGVWKGGGDVEE